MIPWSKIWTYAIDVIVLCLLKLNAQCVALCKSGNITKELGYNMAIMNYVKVMWYESENPVKREIFDGVWWVKVSVTFISSFSTPSNPQTNSLTFSISSRAVDITSVTSCWYSVQCIAYIFTTLSFVSLWHSSHIVFLPLCRLSYLRGFNHWLIS